MNKYVSFSCLLLLALCAVTAQQLRSSALATAGVFGTRCLDQTGCCDRCPACDHQCNLKAEQTEEDRLCFDVETKAICIPRVVFPWQKKSFSACDSCDGKGCNACTNNGARVRKVCVLKASSYQCPKCKYTWSAEERVVCDGGCDSGACDCVAAPAVEVLHAPASEKAGKSDAKPTQKEKVPPAPVMEKEKLDEGSVQELPPPAARWRSQPTRLPNVSRAPFSRW